jgi:hypothetical protein
MDSVLIGIAVAIWFLCGVLAYGGLFAHLQKKYVPLADADYRGDRSYAIVLALFGPVGLLVVALATRCFRDGFKFQ